MNPPSLGYVILYVNDVAASLAFYEKAFGLARRFFHDDNGKAYGELETGATRLAFASVAVANDVIAAGEHFECRDPGECDARQITLMDLPDNLLFRRHL